MFRRTFGLQQVIMVGDRGMITSARITELRKIEGMAWITSLRGPAIRKLMDDGPLSPLRDRPRSANPDRVFRRRRVHAVVAALIGRLVVSGCARRPGGRPSSRPRRDGFGNPSHGPGRPRRAAGSRSRVAEYCRRSN